MAQFISAESVYVFVKRPGRYSMYNNPQDVRRARIPYSWGQKEGATAPRPEHRRFVSVCAVTRYSCALSKNNRMRMLWSAAKPAADRFPPTPRPRLPTTSCPQPRPRGDPLALERGSRRRMRAAPLDAPEVHAVPGSSA
ncbi:hypothetical protein NDU88_012512 [Pleurodeles waltl]|uniref:Uncharacterized protein n=1 Tax=Pleurodeles waltl TaxID=8319 RepID=A0AAV7R0C5_PLEWA|nr:hypothetical protein NDU88_012512 [Pleurodeles waltl]